MEWVEEFETGLTELDEHHREIFLSIQKIAELKEPLSRAKLAELLVVLEELMRSHCECEERLMVASGYPDLKGHTTEHAKLLSEMQSYRDGGVFSPRQLAVVLSNWLMSHTLMDDRPLVRHLQLTGDKGSSNKSPCV